MMRQLLRETRYRLHALLSSNTSHVTVGGVKLSLDGMSDRMRYVLQHGYERDDAELAAEYFSPQDRVLEVGAAIGFMALTCQLRIGISHYQLVEANPYLEQSIRTNYALNNMGEPQLLVVGVGPEDGELSFGISKHFWSSSALVRSAEVKRIVVPQRSLMSIVQVMPFQPNVLIMDVEGAEVSIPPNHFLPFAKILVETHRTLVGDKAVDGLLAGLSEVGFREVARRGATLLLTRP